MSKQRLSKVIAASGLASRRAAETLIFDGKATVNGKKVLLPQTMVDPHVDTIEVDGKRISLPSHTVYYALNKPVGYHCTNAPTVKRRAIDLIDPPSGARLFTVGRLDKDTSGLIIVTNDGHFANRVMHPSGGVKKEYIAKVDQEITHDHLVTLARGCMVQHAFVRPVRVAKVRRATIRIVVQEGRRHEVRQMLEAVGLSVLELKRVKIGNLCLGTTPVGAYRELTQQEIERLFPDHTPAGAAPSSKRPRRKLQPRR